MSKEELLKAIMELPKTETNNLISSMNSINVDDLISAVDRLNKIPNYNDLLKENKQLKEVIDKAIEYIKEKYDYILGDDTFLDHDEIIDRKQIIHILELLGDKEVSEWK